MSVAYRGEESGGGLLLILCPVVARFDSELQLLQDELRGERQQRERLSREKEIALGEKYSMEQNLSVSSQPYWSVV